MADFGYALRWLKEGKRVRRRSWDANQGDYHYIDLDTTEGKQFHYVWGVNHDHHYDPTVEVYLLLADDWEPWVAPRREP